MPSSDPSSQSFSPSQTNVIGMHFLLAQVNCSKEHGTPSETKEKIVKNCEKYFVKQPNKSLFLDGKNMARPP
jgi:hypothetical protein